MSKRTAGKCRRCGCTDHDCTDCVERTGRPCHWVEPDLCSACTPRFEVLGLVFSTRPRPANSAPSHEPLTGWIYIVHPPDGEPEEYVGRPGLINNTNWLVELVLPPDLWAIARRLLPRLAKKGALRL